MEIRYTTWPTLYDIDSPTEVVTTWEELTNWTHTRVRRKDQATGFSPYVTCPPPYPCIKHQGGARDKKHRCNTCVDEVTLLVFDADAGTEEDVERCKALLRQDGVAQHWYSTYSHNHLKSAHRLVIPISRPVSPDWWFAIRLAALQKYAIPANPKQCSGASHFYYVPSCPDWATPSVYTGVGEPLDVNRVAPQIPRVRIRAPLVSIDWTPPDEPEGQVEIQPYLDKLRERLARISRNHAYRERADLLRKCLAGEALAGHGHRNNAALTTTGILAWALPNAPLSVLMHVIRPSLAAMVADGSSLTEDVIERMFLTAMRHRANSDAHAEAIAKQAQAKVDALLEAARKHVYDV